MTVTHIRAPHTTFHSQADLEEFGDEAIAIERAIGQFIKDRCEPGLYEDLRAFGWPDSEIAEVVKNPHAALVCDYGVAEQYR